MSFIDMMANDDWSDADITNKTEAMLRQFCPVQEELILNRKVQGAAAGQYQLTPAEQQQVVQFTQLAFLSKQAGIAARADMALLRQVWTAEAADRRLAEPELAPELDEDGNVVNQTELDADAAERAAAQAVLDAASPVVLGWVEKRRPPPPVEDPAEEPPDAIVP